MSSSQNEKNEIKSGDTRVSPPSSTSTPDKPTTFWNRWSMASSRGQKKIVKAPSVHLDESQVDEISKPEIKAGKSVDGPAYKNTSAVTTATTKFKIRKSHAIIGLIAIGAVLLGIIVAVLFSENSSLKDQLSENKAAIAELKAKTNATIAVLEADLKARDNANKATIAVLEADLKARDNANKATIASLESHKNFFEIQMKYKDNQILNIVNKVKHVEVGSHVNCGDSSQVWQCGSSWCTILKTVLFKQSYDTAPLVAVSFNAMYDNIQVNNFGFRVTSVEESGFTVECRTNGNNNQHMYFTWISLPNI